MVLASADEKTDLAKLTDMADKIIEVAAPYVSAISHTTSDAEIEKLRAEVTHRSEVSTIPPTPADRQHSPDSLALTAVNNTSIRTYGQRSLTLNLGLRRSLPWIFGIN